MQHAPCLHCVLHVFLLHCISGPYGNRDNYEFSQKGSMLNMCKPTKSQTKVQGGGVRQEKESERETCENLWEVRRLGNANCNRGAVRAYHIDGTHKASSI